MRRTRIAGWVLAAGSLAVLVASVGAMALRVRDYAEPARFDFRVIEQRALEFCGRPVRFEDTRGDDGAPALRIVYGERERLLQGLSRPADGIASLGIYGDWVRVLAFSASTNGVPEPGGRLVVVRRQLPPGYDALTWGTVRRHLWTFEFTELLPDGGFEVSTFRFPSRRDPSDRAKATLPESREIMELPAMGERSWQFNAALFVIPRLQMPSYRFREDAFEVMGWTLPVAAFAVFALLLGLGLALAPDRRHPGPGAPTNRPQPKPGPAE